MARDGTNVTPARRTARPEVLSRSLPFPRGDATRAEAVGRRAVTVIRLCRLRHLRSTIPAREVTADEPAGYGWRGALHALADGSGTRSYFSSAALPVLSVETS